MFSEAKNQRTVSGSYRPRTVAEHEAKVVTEELISRLRSGSQEAFKTVYIHYYGSLERFLFSLLRSKEESEEMAQDVFMTIWEKREQLDPSKNIKSFIYTIARNSVMNLFDHRKVLDRYARTANVPVNDDITSEDILIAQETELLIELAVARMPRMRRRIFELNRYEDMDNASIADRLGISKANVANHLALARKDIKEILALFLLFILS